MTRPPLYRENAIGAEPTLLTEEELAQEGALEELKCLCKVELYEILKSFR